MPMLYYFVYFICHFQFYQQQKLNYLSMILKNGAQTEKMANTVMGRSKHNKQTLNLNPRIFYDICLTTINIAVVNNF